MGYTVKQMNIVARILEEAEDEIRQRTGMDCKVMLVRSDLNDESPREMLNVIAAALNENPEGFQYKSKKQELVDMRFIAANLLKKIFPRITLTEIGELFGGQDHSTIVNSLQQATTLIDNKDTEFCYKYNIASAAVQEWRFASIKVYGKNG